MEWTGTAGGGASAADQPLRPLSVGEILGAAIDLYRRNSRELWTIVAVVVVPLAALQQIIVGASLPSGAFVHHGTLYTPTGTISIPAGAAIATAVLSFLAAVVMQGALALCLVDAYLGHPLDWRESLSAGLSRLGSLVWLSILFIIPVTIGLILVIVPGLYLITVWSVAVPALMFERLGGAKALGRSFDLVRGRWWATFGALVVAVIMTIVVLFVLSLIFVAIDKGLKVNSIGLWLVLRFLSSVIADLVAYPFLAAVIAVLYIDHRVRKEGLSRDVLAGALGRAPSSAQAAGLS